MIPSKRVSRAIWLSGMAVCLLGLITSLVILVAPYSWIKSGLDWLATDGQAEFFSRAFHAQLRSVAQILVVVFGAALALGFSLRNRILTWLEHIHPGIKQNLQFFGQDLALLTRSLIHGNSRQSRSSRIEYLVALSLITLLATAIRLAYLFAPIRYDEAYSFLVFALQPVRFILTDYHVPNNHIFHTLLMRLAYHLSGSQIWSLRLPVLIAGVLLVPMTYMVGALAFGKGARVKSKGKTSGNEKDIASLDLVQTIPDRTAGLLASALVAASTTLIEFSTNARGYMWVCLLTMVILWLALYLKDHYNRAAWALLALFSAIGFFTIPIFLYPFGMVMSWLLVCWLLRDTNEQLEQEDQRRRFFWSWLATGLATGALVLLLYTPLIRAGGMGDLLGNRFVSAVEAAGFNESILARMRVSWADWVRDLPFLGMMTLAIGFLTAIFSSKRLSGARLAFPLVGLAWIILVVGIQRVTPWPRIWIFLLPIFLAWSAGGLVAIARAPLLSARAIPPLKRLPQGARTGLVLVSICLLATGLVWNVYRSGSILEPSQAWGKALPDEQETAIFLAGEVGEGDVIGTAIPVNYPLRYYLLLEGIPEKFLFRKVRDKDFQRALVVVHQGYGQTLADVLKKTKLDEFIDQDQARLLHTYHSSQVFEITRR